MADDYWILDRKRSRRSYCHKHGVDLFVNNEQRKLVRLLDPSMVSLDTSAASLFAGIPAVEG